YDSNRIVELQPEAFSFTGEMESETSFLTELESPFSEAEEVELAIELLEVTSEAELEQFLGNLFKKAWQGIKTIGSKVLRPLVKTVLPIAATAAGTFFGGPAGGAIAGKLGSLVSKALEAETAGVSPEDRDVEKCRQFVRMAGAAARAAALAPPGANPVAVAQRVLANAAQRKLTMGTPGGSPAAPKRRCRCGQPGNCTCGQSGKSGRWIRRGRDIVIINCQQLREGHAASLQARQRL
ncbi:MAG TPA: hypothetical protein VLQ80_21460, partial [Candidatus Saccharimonadia bacterium]|nr:hypothetical protein [Candidatus Saccharimonadia bacterium]